MKRYDLIVIGAGPAGLSAATEAAKHGLHPLVLDENEKPGGQLFKQIHKFFGSKEHKAKIRGFKIGEELLAEAEKYGVEVMLNATVIGLYPEKEITVRIGDEVKHMKGDAILVATGASENMVTFPGWTLPGVIGAGAAQTMMNLHHIKAGEKILMQGIIDAYFIEDDEIVLVDYKTDKVSPGGEQHLIDLYHIQLEDYAAALERMLQKKVKETFIYSFTLRKMIPLS